MFLISGHSFVRRPSSDLSFRFNTHAFEHFHLLGDTMIHLHGVDGRAMEKLHLYGVVSSLEPDIIILEIGTSTNYLFTTCPVVGSKTDDLVQYLLEPYSVLSVFEVIPHFGASFFNKVAQILNQYLNHDLELCINIISWRHMSFSNPKVRVCLHDGFHLNSHGQYSLYRTPILKALHSL